MLFELDENSIKNHVIQSKGYVLVDFYATWCKSCESLETTLELISEDYFDKLKVYKFNVELDESIVDQLEIFGLPTIVLFKDGIAINRLEGLHSEKKIKEWLAL